MASSRDKLKKKSQEKKQEVHTTRKSDAFDAFIERERPKNILIDPVFQSLIPPLQDEEFETLEQSIRAEGVREDLLLWKDPEDESLENFLLVDGHNRYQIIQKIEAEGSSIKYGVRVLDLPSKDAVKDWMITNQLGRRNLTNEQRSYLRGLRYEREKASHGGERAKETSPQNGNMQKTHEKLGEEYSVSKNTILRDAEFARGIEKIGVQNPELKREILAGRQKVKKADLQLLGREKDDAPLSVASLEALYNTLDALKPKKQKAQQSETTFDALKKDLIRQIQKLGINSSAEDIEKTQRLIKKIISEIKQ